MSEQHQPSLPYAGTEGYVASPASRGRAERNARDGTARNRQERFLATLAGAGARGLTWGEIADAYGLHHGQASSTLSVLHKAGLVFQLSHMRGQSHPYVHIMFQGCYPDGQRIDAPARTKARQVIADAYIALVAARNDGSWQGVEDVIALLSDGQ